MYKVLIFVRNFFAIPVIIAGIGLALWLYFYPFYWIAYHYICDDAPTVIARTQSSWFFGGLAGVIFFALMMCAINMTEDDMKKKANEPKKEKPAKPVKVKKSKEDKSWLNS